MRHGTEGQRQIQDTHRNKREIRNRRHGLCVVEEESQWREHHGETGAEILEYVVTVSRNNVLYMCFRVNDRWRVNN